MGTNKSKFLHLQPQVSFDQVLEYEIQSISGKQYWIASRVPLWGEFIRRMAIRRAFRKHQLYLKRRKYALDRIRRENSRRAQKNGAGGKVKIIKP
jgi:hypothetical protein